MKKSKVIDFFSGQSFEEITTRDFNRTDELTDKYGVYLGCFGMKDTQKLRKLRAELDFKREQIDHLTREWERIHAEHYELLHYCLGYLNIPERNNLNLEKDDVTLSSEGHVWAIYNCSELEEWEE